MIAAIGLEVEGGWNGKKGVPPFPDMDIIPDRSIDGRTLPTDRPMMSPHVGEVVSRPLDPTKENIHGWIDKYWPHETNATCGYHIHLSFTKIKEYSLLTLKSFLFLLRKRMGEVGKDLALPPEHYLWARLAGTNPFATMSFDASRQIQLERKAIGDRTRYGFINCCWGIHKTIEFRALPTFPDKNHAKIFTMEYLKLVEKFLEKTKGMKFEASGSVVDSFDVVSININ